MSFHICQRLEELTVPTEELTNGLVSLVAVDLYKTQNYLTLIESLR